MLQMYRIYINDTALIITESVPENAENFQQIGNQAFDFLSFYNKVKNRRDPGFFLLLTKNPKKAFQNVKSVTKIIRAAGGLVRNEHNKYLFIFRKGMWDLPKGKLDPGEKTKVAAVREVEEECGIRVTKPGKKICKTWHVYEINNKVILKKTTWYSMEAFNQKKLVPQLEEEITAAEWVAAGDFKKIRKNTYPSILDVIGSVEL